MFFIFFKLKRWVYPREELLLFSVDYLVIEYQIASSHLTYNFFVDKYTEEKDRSVTPKELKKKFPVGLPSFLMTFNEYHTIIYAMICYFQIIDPIKL